MRPVSGRIERVPFAIAAVLPILLTLLFGPNAGSVDFIVSAALTALLIGAALIVPWGRVPQLRATVPLAYFAAVFLLRDSSATASVTYTLVVLLPVIWLALYGTRTQLTAAFLLLALTLILPMLLYGAPRYPPAEWRRVAIFLMIAPIVGFTIHRLVGVTRERAERLRVSEGATRAAEARYEAAFEHTPIGIGIIDTGGQFMSVNPALCKLLGYTRSDLLRSSPAAITHPDDRERGISLVRSLIAGKLDSYEVEERFLHADGHPIDVSIHAALVRDSEDKPLQVVGQALDITAHKRLATLRERELELTQQGRQQLIEQNARLVEIDRMKDEFVALVSHELRTPLTSIVGYLELILDHEAGPLTPTLERFLKTIDRNARALSTRVGDLLFLASVGAGKLTLNNEDVDLAQLVAETVEACGPSTDRRGITLTVDTNAAPTVRGDRARLAQLTDNLMSNAIKFTPDGGHVEVRGHKNESNAIIEIRDSGVGIPADEIPRLFTRFYRASSATEHAIPGTGLGLAIVKSIADAHHGAIEVDSSPGVGTTMRLLLPVGPSKD
jgi:PAS domain S-box-containing protein